MLLTHDIRDIRWLCWSAPVRYLRLSLPGICRGPGREERECVPPHPQGHGSGSHRLSSAPPLYPMHNRSTQLFSSKLIQSNLFTGCFTP